MDQLATRSGRSLTINNYAVGGSRISWIPTGTNFFDFQSTFNAWGQMVPGWQGTAVIMSGWNNTYISAEFENPPFLTAFRGAKEAECARAIIDDWGGISINGWKSDGTLTAIPGWSTTGSNNQYIHPTAGDRRKVMPFWYGDTTASTTRYRVDLDGTDTLQFTLTNKRGIGLFFDTSANGGAFTVSVNGIVVTTDTSLVDTSGYYGLPNQFPGCIWIENLPSTAVIKITKLSDGGHLYWLAAGWTNRPSLPSTPEKTIILATTVANTFAADGMRSLSMLQKVAQQAETAAGIFADYPVYFASPFATWQQDTDSDPQDPSHLTPSGNEHVTLAFETAIKLSKVNSERYITYQNSEPTPSPTPKPNAPTIKITTRGLATTKASQLISGTTKGQVTSITYLIGSGPKKTLKTTGKWKFTAKLRIGKNPITVTATGPGGTSRPARIMITRKRK